MRESIVWVGVTFLVAAAIAFTVGNYYANHADLDLGCFETPAEYSASGELVLGGGYDCP